MRLAIDIGGTLVKCALVTDDGGIIAMGDFPTSAGPETDDFGKRIAKIASVFLDKNLPAGETSEAVTMVGAGMAGFTDGKRGIVYESPNLPWVKNFELARVLSEGLGIPAFIDNDATAAAWGEYLFGNHGDIRDMLVVTLGTGIGGGLVLGGRLYRGAGGMAGEIGQMVLLPGGPDCPGGPKGCLEYFSGKAGLMEEYRALAGLAEPVEPNEIFARALDGDQAAQDAYAKYGKRLGVIFASTANLLDLGAIILTGGIIGAWEFFEPDMAGSFRDHLITPHKERLKIEKTTLDGNAGILGAAFLDRA